MPETIATAASTSLLAGSVSSAWGNPSETVALGAFLAFLGAAAVVRTYSIRVARRRRLNERLHERAELMRLLGYATEITEKEKSDES